MPRIAPPPIQDNELTRTARVAFQLESIVDQLKGMNERQAKHEGKMETKLETIERQINAMPEKYATKMEVKEAVKPIQTDVDGINANITWAARIVIGAVIAALLGLIIYTRQGGL